MSLLPCLHCGELPPIHGPGIRDVLSSGDDSRMRAELPRDVFRRIQSIWMNARGRCFWPHNKAWKNYGGRGIRMCPRWFNNLQAFWDDMGMPPPGTSLDRVNVDGDYSRENCRWADAFVQARNKQSRRYRVVAGENENVAVFGSGLTVYRANNLMDRLRVSHPVGGVSGLPINYRIEIGGAIPRPRKPKENQDHGK